ncbi:hypothetical protein DSL72_005203 [Monilinia vaccinii-corymbosi]|uniref:ER transporter 6TM N-terminal domain-containing protein n=1 Tax=Monilinia vaccinii-corymbosi TaxID=61207 RepID=A0A8A3PEZ3_9HELO|nr:hypothetical protein DSL72_005203 [Monilinia vaccinii-corymbosi]
MGTSIWNPGKWEEWADKRARAIWTNLQANHLWQRMLKVTLATTICIIIAVMPRVVAVYGKAAYLAPVATVFGHPGRRFGMMAEALILVLSGTMLGIAWSMLALYLSSLMYDSDPQAAFTIRGIFLAVAVLFHGVLRSRAPRLFLMVLLLVIVVVVSMTSTATAVAIPSVTQLVYPIVTAIAVLLVVNTLVFPESSSSFLGITTIETLGETVGALRDAGRYFIAISEGSESAITGTKLEAVDSASGSGNGADLNISPTLAEKPPQKSEVNFLTLRQKILSVFHNTKKLPEPVQTNVEKGPQPVKLKSLTDKKAKLRAKLAGCKAAQQECNFELAWAALPPRDVKNISDIEMKKLVANTIALIGACESKYALMGDENDKKEAEAQDEAQLKTAVAGNAGIDNPEAEDSSRPTTDVDTHDELRSDEKKPSRKERRRQKKKRRKDRKKIKSLVEEEMENLELIKPRKEIEYGDIDLLKYLVQRIAKPLSDLQEMIDRSVDVVSCSLAYCYDVPKLPSGIRAPAGIRLKEIDIRVDILMDAIADFDKNSASALEGAAALQDLGGPQIDIMPRMETFLISLFLLNLRQAALHTLGMLRHSRVLVERRQELHDRKRLYLPQINWRKWLQSGGEADMLALPDGARKNARTGNKNDDDDDVDDGASVDSGNTIQAKNDVESAMPKKETPVQSPKTPGGTVKRKKKGTRMFRLQNRLADIIEYLVGSDDISYAIKLTVAVLLLTWPAFLVQWNTWYSVNRGLWAALQLVLITEVAIGTAVMTFMLRAVGTTVGCIWGYAAYQVGQGNRVVAVILIVIGIIPSAYIQLGSKYIKAGMVTIISMTVVVLATVDHTVPGSATENFLKRLIAFFIGGVVALIVQVVLFPVKARDRLVESLASSIRQITEMEACLAYGIETEINNVNVNHPAVISRFSIAKGKAEAALAAAKTFLPFCANEPRLKGSFAPHALIYGEILYVLHSIIDRMENMLILRHEYGSGILDLNAQVYPYRRNVAGSITLILFAAHEALTTKLPLPQFLPSARLAHLRLVNRVREVVVSSHPKEFPHERSEIEVSMVKRFVRQKFLSWNAASAGQIEVIEYLEELIDLVKLLVGANEFRSGLLTRGSYREWADKIQRPDTVESETLSTDGAVEEKLPQMTMGRKRRPTFSNTREKIFGPSTGNMAGARPDTTRPNAGVRIISTKKLEVEKQKNDMEDEIPRVLRRVRTRRMDEMRVLGERRSRDDMGTGTGTGNLGKGNRGGK